MAEPKPVKFLKDFETDEQGNQRSKAEILKVKSQFIKDKGFDQFEQIVRNSSKK